MRLIHKFGDILTYQMSLEFLPAGVLIGDDVSYLT